MGVLVERDDFVGFPVLVFGNLFTVGGIPRPERVKFAALGAPGFFEDDALPTAGILFEGFAPGNEGVPKLLLSKTKAI